MSSARVTTGAALVLLDTRSRHVGFLTVRLRAAVTSTPLGGAAEPAVGVNVEEQESNALLSSPEFVQHSTKPATKDPEDDVESLGRVVHNIKTLVEKVPETSEVCSFLNSISQGRSYIHLQLRPYANIAWKVMYLAHKV